MSNNRATTSITTVISTRRSKKPNSAAA